MKKNWILAGQTNDFKSGEKKRLSVNNEDIIIYRKQDTWFAFEALCPHMSRTLETGIISDSKLTCIYHNMIFDLETGTILDDSGFIDLENLKRYPVKIQDKNIFIKFQTES